MSTKELSDLDVVLDRELSSRHRILGRGCCSCKTKQRVFVPQDSFHVSQIQRLEKDFVKTWYIFVENV